MRYLKILLLCLLASIQPAYALLNLELTQGVSGAVPLVIAPFTVSGVASSQNPAEIVQNDLEHSGRFKIYSHSGDINAANMQHLGADNIVVGKVQGLGGDRYQVSFELIDAFKAKDQHKGIVLQQQFTVSEKQLRQVAHHISDLIYERILGVRGIFSTRLVYIVVNKSTPGRPQYTLEVADEDGFNPRILLTSTDPIMSPTWSPSGRQVAYVSFENRRASIYMQDVATGSRTLVSRLPGINGAPAWSPDGTKMALVLSKGQSPNIYILDLNGHQLTQVTNDYYINTEPAWAPDGKYLIFTSTRSGGPQIYQYNFASRSISRLTYDGKYNARGGITTDGHRLVTIHKDSDAYNIALFDLGTGVMRLLTPSGTRDSSSPSVAPNGSMVLYDTVYHGRNMLAMVSTDGRVQLRLPARDGEAQDPAWSPFLS